MKEDYRFSEEFLAPTSHIICNCDNQLRAEKIFRQRNIYGETKLEMLELPTGERFFYWTCRKNDKLLASIQLFFGSQHLNKQKTTVVDDTTMHQYSGHFYYMLKGKNDKFAVYTVNVFASTEDVRKYCRMKHIDYDKIEMHYITTVQENKKISVCWTISAENAEGGRTIILLPVCWKDRHKISQYDLNKLNIEPVKENDIIYVNGKLYLCKKNCESYIFLQRCALQIVE